MYILSLYINQARYKKYNYLHCCIVNTLLYYEKKTIIIYNKTVCV